MLFLDEIQYLADWERHLKAFVDTHPGVKCAVSGSAAAALRLKSIESGAGRFTDFLLPPLTFHERRTNTWSHSNVWVLSERRHSFDRTRIASEAVISSGASATRQGWSRGNGVCDDPMKPCLSSSGCETRPAKGEPARPVASLAPETETDSAKRRHASEWAVGR